MNDKSEALLSDRARQITCLSKENDVEKMRLVVKSYYDLSDTAEAVGCAAHTLHLTLTAAYKMSRLGGVKYRAMKALIMETEKDLQLQWDEDSRSRESQRTLSKSGCRIDHSRHKHLVAASTPD